MLCAFSGRAEAITRTCRAIGATAGRVKGSTSVNGTVQPIAAIQSSVIPVHGFFAGCCAIIFMQSSLIPAMAAGAAAGDGIDAKAAA